MQFHSPTALMHEARNLKTEANVLVREQVLETERVVVGGLRRDGFADWNSQEKRRDRYLVLAMNNMRRLERLKPGDDLDTAYANVLWYGLKGCRMIVPIETTLGTIRSKHFFSGIMSGIPLAPPAGFDKRIRDASAEPTPDAEAEETGAAEAKPASDVEAGPANEAEIKPASDAEVKLAGDAKVKPASDAEVTAASNGEIKPANDAEIKPASDADVITNGSGTGQRNDHVSGEGRVDGGNDAAGFIDRTGDENMNGGEISIGINSNEAVGGTGI